jgi:hypothetical protein
MLAQSYHFSRKKHHATARLGWLLALTILPDLLTAAEETAYCENFDASRDGNQNASLVASGLRLSYQAVRPPHSPPPVPVLTVSGAAGAKANSLQS